MIGNTPYRVISPYSLYQRGDIIYPAKVLRDVLLQQGRIEPVAVEDLEPLVQAATMPEPETAAEPTPKRKRGRPRKVQV